MIISYKCLSKDVTYTWVLVDTITPTCRDESWHHEWETSFDLDQRCELVSKTKSSLQMIDDSPSLTRVVWKVILEQSNPPPNLTWGIKHLNYMQHQYVQLGCPKLNFYQYFSLLWILIITVFKIHKIGIHFGFCANEPTKLWFVYTILIQNNFMGKRGNLKAHT